MTQMVFAVPVKARPATWKVRGEEAPCPAFAGAAWDGVPGKAVEVTIAVNISVKIFANIMFSPFLMFGADLRKLTQNAEVLNTRLLQAGSLANEVRQKRTYINAPRQSCSAAQPRQGAS